MTEKQKLRMVLLLQNECNLAKAKEAYEFVIGSDIEDGPVATGTGGEHKSNIPDPRKDGVYLRYADGREEWFDGKNKKEDVVGIAVHLGERHTCIAKFDVEDNDEGDNEFPLLKSSENDTEEDKKAFITSYFDAYNDLDGKKHTESLMRRGCKIPLAENQYIPSQGEWLLVLMFFKKVQEALDYACGEMLKDDWYWSSTECSSNLAWYVNVSNGNIGSNYGKTSTYKVRPCLSCEAI